jgi:hypothetical protein
VAAYTTTRPDLNSRNDILRQTYDKQLVIIDGQGGLAYVYSQPVTGNTITLALGDRRLVLQPAGTLATLSVVLPPTPEDGNTFTLSSSQEITAITVTAPGGATVQNGVGALGAGGSMGWLYHAADTTWYSAI